MEVDKRWRSLPKLVLLDDDDQGDHDDHDVDDDERNNDEKSYLRSIVLNILNIFQHQCSSVITFILYLSFIQLDARTPPPVP